jgi:hypothetical protein
MAKFTCDFSDVHSLLSGENAGDIFTVDELLEVLRPAGLRLKDFYQKTIRRLFKQHTGSLAESIDIEDDTVGREYAFITVKPFGTHKGGSYARKSRAGPAGQKYAKHNRSPSKKQIKNEEIAYFLEHGTPRIAATHWMENANEEVSDEIQDIVESEFDKLLQKKGLI